MAVTIAKSGRTVKGGRETAVHLPLMERLDFATFQLREKPVGEENLQAGKVTRIDKIHRMRDSVSEGLLGYQALVSVIQDAYINGVSTRKVDHLVESLGLEIDKSKVSRLCKSIGKTVEQFRNRSLRFQEYPYLYLDATFPKVREGVQVQSMGLVIAIGVNRNDDREVLGFDIGTAENGPFWKSFLGSLTARGLHGVKLVISDAHPGLKEAIGQVFPGIPWQRCRVHFMRNVLSQVPKKYQGMVSAMVRTIFTADKVEEAKKLLRMVVGRVDTIEAR